MRRFVVTLFLLAACAAPPPAAAPAGPSCAEVTATGDADVDLATLAERCAPGMRQVPGEARGVQGASDPSTRLVLGASGRDRCFRVLAAGSVGVSELDVLVVDPQGRPLARDTRRGPLAVVSDDGLLCLPEGVPHVVEIAVTGGQGAFVARAYHAR